MRKEATAGQLIAETALPREKELHDVLTNHPELIPAEDLGLSRLVVVGRESGLVSGYADLVLVDDAGRLCLVEVKKEGNPDTRQVVAQLLDYAAALWGQSLAEFERAVLLPYLESLHSEEATGDLLTYLAAAFDEPDDDADRAPLIAERLAQALETGEFTLVVAAPRVPPGVQRVLEYMNARGQRYYALEVSYFKGPAECFVPRLVVMPQAAGPSAHSTAPPAIDRAAFLSELPAHLAAPVAEFLDKALELGAEVVWRGQGASVTVGKRQVANPDLTHLYATLRAPSGFPEDAFNALAEHLRSVGAGKTGSHYYSVKWSDLSAEQAGRAFAVLLQFIAGLLRTVAGTPKQSSTPA